MGRVGRVPRPPRWVGILAQSDNWGMPHGPPRRRPSPGAGRHLPSGSRGGHAFRFCSLFKINCSATLFWVAPRGFPTDWVRLFVTACSDRCNASRQQVSAADRFKNAHWAASHLAHMQPQPLGENRVGSLERRCEPQELLAGPNRDEAAGVGDAQQAEFDALLLAGMRRALLRGSSTGRGGTEH